MCDWLELSMAFKIQWIPLYAQEVLSYRKRNGNQWSKETPSSKGHLMNPHFLNTYMYLAPATGPLSCHTLTPYPPHYKFL